MPWGVAAAVGGALVSADASKSAAKTQAGAADRASQVQLDMFNTTNNQQAPYRQSGENSLNNLNYLLGYSGSGLGGANVTTDSTLANSLGMGSGSLLKPFTAADLQSNLAPNYQFQLDQGLGAVRNAGNMQSGLLSGNTLKGINDYAQNFAGNAYQQAFNNYNANQANIFNRLSSIAGLGQTANQATGQAATAAGQGIAGSTMAGGAAQAAGGVGAANALSGGLNNAFGWYKLNDLMKPSGSTYGQSNDDLSQLWAT